jgi:hypothetical protein
MFLSLTNVKISNKDFNWWRNKLMKYLKKNILMKTITFSKYLPWTNNIILITCIAINMQNVNRKEGEWWEVLVCYYLNVKFILELVYKQYTWFWFYLFLLPLSSKSSGRNCSVIFRYKSIRHAWHTGDDNK